MDKVPFLRPRLVELEDYAPLLKEMDAARQYTNFGPLNTRFEKRVVDEWMGGEGAATTVCNATLGLMLAISDQKRPNARYAVMPSFTFAATPLAAQWCGLEPYFVDVDPEEWVLDQTKLRRALDELGREAAVVVPYATCGTHMDLRPYEMLIRSGVPVVVDAAPCFGTSLGRRQFGTGFSGAVVFSFHATKAFPIGEGGLVYSADMNSIKRMKLASNYWFDGGRESIGLGLNAKLSELGAAVALATLDHFPEVVARRKTLYQRYVAMLRETGLLEQGWSLQGVRGEAAYQWLPLLAPDVPARDHLMRIAADRNIELRRYFVPPCHEHPQFQDAPAGDLEMTRTLGERVVSLPLWEDLNDEMLKRVVDAVVDASRACAPRMATAGA
ncbi:MAG: DegT/DnrJ/EryC1/StrS aminotransferase family protein [Burkholderiales bacterium]|jgi:dTDP-4-amino-4,6-dideoxygalactose transaminase